MADAVIGYAVFGWAPFGCFVVGLMYLVSAPRTGSMANRLVPAMYAPSAALMYVAIGLAPIAVRGLLQAKATFFVLHAIPLALLVTSLYSFRGPRWVHGVLVPVGLVCMSWQLVWAYWFVYGK